MLAWAAESGHWHTTHSAQPHHHSAFLQHACSRHTVCCRDKLITALQKRGFVACLCHVEVRSLRDMALFITALWDAGGASRRGVLMRQPYSGQASGSRQGPAGATNLVGIQHRWNWKKAAKLCRANGWPAHAGLTQAVQCTQAMMPFEDFPLPPETSSGHSYPGCCAYVTLPLSLDRSTGRYAPTLQHSRCCKSLWKTVAISTGLTACRECPVCCCDVTT